MISIAYDAATVPGFPLGRRELGELLSLCCEAMGMEDAAFSLRLVDDAEIARLNSEFLGCTGPTNILSFPAEQGDDEAEYDDVAADTAANTAADDADGDTAEGESWGELALSVPTLVRETELYGQTPLEHTARLLSHGILHLAGYDHGPEMDMLTDAAVEAALESLGSQT